MQVSHFTYRLQPVRHFLPMVSACDDRGRLHCTDSYADFIVTGAVLVTARQPLGPSGRLSAVLSHGKCKDARRPQETEDWWQVLLPG